MAQGCCKLPSLSPPIFGDMAILGAEFERKLTRCHHRHIAAENRSRTKEKLTSFAHAVRGTLTSITHNGSCRPHPTNPHGENSFLHSSGVEDSNNGLTCFRYSGILLSLCLCKGLLQTSLGDTIWSWGNNATDAPSPYSNPLDIGWHRSHECRYWTPIIKWKRRFLVTDN